MQCVIWTWKENKIIFYQSKKWALMKCAHWAKKVIMNDTEILEHGKSLNNLFRTKPHVEALKCFLETIRMTEKASHFNVFGFFFLGEFQTIYFAHILPSTPLPDLPISLLTQFHVLFSPWEFGLYMICKWKIPSLCIKHK